MKIGLRQLQIRRWRGTASKIRFPSEQNLADAERALGCSLPAPYRTFLALGSGGPVVVGSREWLFFPVLDDFARELGVGNLATETIVARHCLDVPADAIAMATNHRGDLLVMVPGVAAPMVWDHEARDLEPAGFGFEELLRA